MNLTVKVTKVKSNKIGSNGELQSNSLCQGGTCKLADNVEEAAFKEKLEFEGEQKTLKMNRLAQPSSGESNRLRSEFVGLGQESGNSRKMQTNEDDLVTTRQLKRFIEFCSGTKDIKVSVDAFKMINLLLLSILELMVQKNRHLDDRLTDGSLKIQEESDADLDEWTLEYELVCKFCRKFVSDGVMERVTAAVAATKRKHGGHFRIEGKDIPAEHISSGQLEAAVPPDGRAEVLPMISETLFENYSKRFLKSRVSHLESSEKSRLFIEFLVNELVGQVVSACCQIAQNRKIKVIRRLDLLKMAKQYFHGNEKTENSLWHELAKVPQMQQAIKLLEKEKSEKNEIKKSQELHQMTKTEEFLINQQPALSDKKLSGLAKLKSKGSLISQKALAALKRRNTKILDEQKTLKIKEADGSVELALPASPEDPDCCPKTPTNSAVASSKSIPEDLETSKYSLHRTFSLKKIFFRSRSKNCSKISLKAFDESDDKNGLGHQKIPIDSGSKEIKESIQKALSSHFPKEKEGNAADGCYVDADTQTDPMDLVKENALLRTQIAFLVDQVAAIGGK